MLELVSNSIALCEVTIVVIKHKMNIDNCLVRNDWLVLSLIIISDTTPHFIDHPVKKKKKKKRGKFIAEEFR